jgi:hypothetical protein
MESGISACADNTRLSGTQSMPMTSLAYYMYIIIITVLTVVHENGEFLLHGTSTI